MRFALAATTLLLLAQPSGASDKPNIILVFTDDQGWGDTSVRPMAGIQQSRVVDYQTPALERMARNGMVFSNAYACAPTCTPSRAGMQFGKTPCRLRQTVVHDILARERGVDCKDETSLAEMIKTVDPEYVTAHFGKWGFHPRSPGHAGYDESDGNTNNGEGDYSDVKSREPLPEDDPKRMFSVTERATDFMTRQAQADRPFFMQVSHYAVHVGLAARSKTLAKYSQLAPGKESHAAYAAMVEDLDSALGMLLEKLDELAIQNKTYVIFTSDNGGGSPQGNRPLRAGKATLWEGGVRVPMVVVGPKVKRGERCDVPVAGWDVYATVNDLLGGDRLPAQFDGGSLRSVLEQGNEGEIDRNTPELIFHFPWYGRTLPMSTIRDGDYKLVMNLHTNDVRLHNLARDLGETRDLSAQEPKVTERLRNRLLTYLADVDAEGLDDMFDARIRELNSYISREKNRPNPDESALERHRRALDETRQARESKEWR